MMQLNFGMIITTILNYETDIRTYRIRYHDIFSVLPFNFDFRMKQLAVIGNLGADAEVRSDGGRKYVTLSIADTVTRKDAQGNPVTTTEWISASINHVNENLLPYLKKGAKIYAIGDCSTRLYSSEKDHRMKAGFNLYIDRIELISTLVDEVPRRLYDQDGVEHPVTKYYFAGQCQYSQLFDRTGKGYSVTPEGWVTTPVKQQIEQDKPIDQQQEKQSDAPFVDYNNSTAEDIQLDNTQSNQ
jgi:single-stranded DNA-binding protein